VFLFIFESIGTSELLLIGITALIFLGPRKMPEMARKIGKMMAEFRGTANEFKETWQREVNFDEEAKALNLNDLDPDPVAHTDPKTTEASPPPPDAPAIKAIDPARLDSIVPAETKTDNFAETSRVEDKKSWL
jgi:Tat protein translocase TatB subunit